MVKKGADEHSTPRPAELYRPLNTSKAPPSGTRKGVVSQLSKKKRKNGAAKHAVKQSSTRSSQGSYKNTVLKK